MSGSRDRRMKELAPLTDPRSAGGGYVNSPFDRGQVVVDTDRAVLLDDIGALLVHLTPKGETEGKDAIGITLGGRINNHPDRSNVLYITDIDGAVRVVAEVLGLMDRAGIGPSFAAAVGRRLDEIDREDGRA